MHADAVIGWAWSVFNDYDFKENSLGFRPRAVRALAAAGRLISRLHRADSVGIDFHKTGFAPYVSSLFLARERDDLMTNCYRETDYGEPIVGLKSFMLSPFIDEQHVDIWYKTSSMPQRLLGLHRPPTVDERWVFVDCVARNQG